MSSASLARIVNIISNLLKSGVESGTTTKANEICTKMVGAYIPGNLGVQFLQVMSTLPAESEHQVNTLVEVLMFMATSGDNNGSSSETTVDTTEQTSNRGSVSPNTADKRPRPTKEYKEECSTWKHNRNMVCGYGSKCVSWQCDKKHPPGRKQICPVNFHECETSCKLIHESCTCDSPDCLKLHVGDLHRDSNY